MVVAVETTGSRSVGLSTQIVRFIVVGALSAVVDYGTYQALLALDVWIHLAKTVGFIFGTTTAYLLNRRWAFNSRGGRASAVKFTALYAVTYVVNIGINALMLAVLPEW